MAENKTNGALSFEQIQGILGGGRARNAYEPKYAAWRNSDEPAIEPAVQWAAEFGTKSAETLYQSFRKVADKAGDLQTAENPEGTVVVKKQKDDDDVYHLFLVDLERFQAMAPAEA